MSPEMEKASLVDAFIDGQHAGKLLLPPALNPFQDHTPEHDAWERGRQGAVNVQMARMVA